MKDLAERCARAEAELERVTADRDNETKWAKQYHDDWVKVRDELERVQKQAAAMQEAIKQAHEALTEFASLYEDHRTTATIELLSKLFQPNSGHNDTFTNGGNDACDPEYKPKILRSARSNSVSPPNKQQK